MKASSVRQSKHQRSMSTVVRLGEIGKSRRDCAMVCRPRACNCLEKKRETNTTTPTTQTRMAMEYERELRWLCLLGCCVTLSYYRTWPQDGRTAVKPKDVNQRGQRLVTGRRDSLPVPRH